MLGKTSPNRFAAIHVGSEQVSVHIVEYTTIQDIKVVEMASRHVALGEETFKTGRISFAAVGEICELLKGYRRMFAEHGVRDYRLVATTAIREAENQQYIIDQIQVKTGFIVEVCDMPQEIFIKYAALFKTVQDRNLLEAENAILFVDISSGGLGITLYKDGELKYQQNIHIGVLRIKEGFAQYQRDSAHFQQALAEYIYSVIEPVQQALNKQDIRYLVLSGTETRLLLTMLGQENPGKLSLVSLADFYKLYDQVKLLNLPQIVQNFGFSEQKAEMVLPTIILYKQILNLTTVGQILIPDTQLIDGITLLHIGEKTKQEWLLALENQTLSLARGIGCKYQYDPSHAASVEKLSLSLFDRLTRIHGLGKRERLLLQAAAILHDIGKFVSLRSHYFYSYRLIRSSDILGFSEAGKNIMANIALYHSKGVPANTDPNLQGLTPKQRVIIAKLAAIIRLADALDRTHRQKINSYEIALKGDELFITVTTQEDYSLEEWTFLDKATFFEDVFGIAAILRRRAG
ncbi:MAG: HD domain-containing protein [Veillonellales bacterium]